MTPETFFENFAHIAEAPNGVKKLRELILQMAVRGTLVAQDPSDEPAVKLLERIRAEKARLVSEKKIRKSDPPTPVTEEEVPYELPKRWEWARLGDIANITTGFAFKSPDYVASGVFVLRVTNITPDGKINKNEAVYFPENKIDTRINRYYLNANDILVVMVGGSLGKIGIVTNEILPALLNQNMWRINPCSQNVIHKYLVLCLRYINNCQLKITNSTHGHLAMGEYEKQPVGLPPFAEQHRIVDKVDQLMTLCDELEAKQQRTRAKLSLLNNAALDRLTSACAVDDFTSAWHLLRDNFDLLYTTPETIAKLRQSILQLAVQGKLVAQDPNDEPASVLLAKIKAEKERLVKEKKIRKSDPLPPVDIDAAPYVLPLGWEWARFSELGEFGRGKSKHRPRNDPSLYKDGQYPLVQTGDVARANRKILTHTGMYNDHGLAQSRLWPKGTMCITIAANIADSGILGLDACFPDSVVGFIPSVEIGDVSYFEYFMRTAKSQLSAFAPSTAQKNINLEILGQVLIPLPCRQELHRIVDKVDHLMALCDELEVKLTKAQTRAGKLTAAAVQGLVSI